jgi:hypothetical protein
MLSASHTVDWVDEKKLRYKYLYFLRAVPYTSWFPYSYLIVLFTPEYAMTLKFHLTMLHDLDPLVNGLVAQGEADFKRVRHTVS